MRFLSDKYETVLGILQATKKQIVGLEENVKEQTDQIYKLQEALPFYNHNDREFNIANGLCIWSVQFDQLIDTDLFNLISNPDKSDEVDPDLMLTISMSNYYSISQINNSIAKAGPKAISMFHCNIRSLQKN